KLRLIQLMSAGYEHVPLDLAAKYGIPVAHYGGSNANVVAEHTILLVLALYRRLLQLEQAVRTGSWRSTEPPLHELRGKRVGLIGLGHIGGEVARRLHAFDAEVVSFSRQASASSVPLSDLLKTSDVVSLHLPLTDQTRSFIGARELALMKP